MLELWCFMFLGLGLRVLGGGIRLAGFGVDRRVLLDLVLATL